MNIERWDTVDIGILTSPIARTELECSENPPNRAGTTELATLRQRLCPRLMYDAHKLPVGAGSTHRWTLVCARHEEAGIRTRLRISIGNCKRQRSVMHL
jgi:hypothetical protein